MVKRPQKHPLGVCTFYHFYPQQTETDMRRVFDGIMSGRVEDIWTYKDIMLGSMAEIVNLTRTLSS